MLQELRATVKAAADDAAAIGDRFRAGDAAPELVARLAAAVAAIEHELARAAAVPDDVRADLAALLALVHATTAAGGRWMDDAAGPELANLHMKARVQKVYGASGRDEANPPP